MSTRSLIGRYIPDCRMIEWVYCHWDGYPESNGVTLVCYWSDTDRLEQLMEMGSLSSLGKRIGTKHGYDDSTDDCTFHKRDMGRDGLTYEAGTERDTEGFLISARAVGAEYAYLWVPGHGWTFAAIPFRTGIETVEFMNLTGYLKREGHDLTIEETVD